MNIAITKRQKDLLEIIYSYIKDSGYPPTFEEMREKIGVSSNQSVMDHLRGLEKGKFIKKSEATARGISILSKGYEELGGTALVGFLGVTSAGAPLEVVEISGEWQEVGQGIAKLNEDIFMLKIQGDSMINAGIDDNDIVLVQSKKEFVSGEIVYAQIGNEGTIKRFISQDKPPYIFLKPENPKYNIILFSEEMEMKGKVVSVLKNKHWKSFS